MNEIRKIHLAHMRQEESFGFHQLASVEFIKCNDTRFREVLTIYQSSLDAFDKAMKPAGASAHTKKLTELDNQRDYAYRGLAAHLRTMIKHFDPVKAEAAHKLKSILDKYGDPTDFPYIEENGVIINLVQELSERSMSVCLQQIGAADWVSELSRLNGEFIELFSERNTEKSTVETGISKSARKHTDEAFKKCVKRINALAELEGTDAYRTVIDAVNKLVDYEQTVLQTRKTKSGNKEEETVQT